MINLKNKHLSLFLFLFITIIACSVISAADLSESNTTNSIETTPFNSIETTQDVLEIDNTISDEINTNNDNSIKKVESSQTYKNAGSEPTSTEIDTLNNQRVNRLEVYAGENVSVRSYTEDDYGSVEGEGMPVQVLLNNTVVATGINDWGESFISFVPEVAGTYNIKVKFLGDDYYATSTSPAKVLVVNARPTELTVDSATTDLDAEIEIPITVTDTLNNTTPSQGTITITNDETTVTTFDVSKDELKFTPNVSKAGETTFTVTYSDSANMYATSTKDITVTVVGQESKTPVTIDVTDVTAKVGDELTIPISVIETVSKDSVTKGTLVVTKDDETIATLNVETDTLQFTADTTEKQTTEYTISYTDESNTYEEAQTAITVTIEEIKPTAIALSYYTPLILNQEDDIKVTVFNALNRSVKLTEGTVELFANDISLGTKDLSSGSAVYTYAPTTKDSVIFTVNYSGSENYLANTTSTRPVLVEGYPSRTTIKNITNTTVNVGEEVAVNITVEDAEYGDPIVNGTVDLLANNEVIATGEVSNNKVTIIFTPTTSGNYTIKARYNGNYLFDESTTTKSVNLEVLDVAELITTRPIFTYYNPVQVGEEVEIKIHLVNNTTSVIKEEGLQVTVYADDTEIGVGTTDATGYATVTYIPEKVGQIKIKVVFNGTDVYAPSEYTSLGYLTVEGKTIRIGYSHYNPVQVGENVEITAYIMNEKGQIIKEAGRELTLYVDGVEVAKAVTGDDGKAIFTYTPEKVAKSKLTVYYAGDDQLASLNYTGLGTLNVEGKTTRISFSHYNPVYVDENVEIKAHVMDENGKTLSLAGEKLTLYVDGIEVATETISDDNNAYFTYIPEKVGKYKVTVYFAGNDEYAALNYTGLGTLNVEGKPIRIGFSHYNPVYVDENVEITAYIMNEKGQIIKEAGNELTLYVDGVEQSKAITGDDGKAIFTYVPDKVAKSKVTVYFAGNDQLASLNFTGLGTLNVEGKPIRIGFSYYNPAYVGENLEIKAYIMDEKGTRLKEAGNELVYYVDGNEIGSANTDENGYAYLTYVPEQAGKSKITVFFAGNDQLASLNFTGLGTLVVDLYPTQIKVNNINTTYKETSTVKISLKETVDNNIPDKGIITIKDSEDNEIATIDVSEDPLEFTYKANKAAGEYVFTAEYNEGTQYNSSISTFKVTIAKRDSIITIDPIEDVAYNDNVTITGKFTDSDNNALINSNVKVLINGKENTVKTNKQGVFTFTTTVNKVGQYNVTVKYPGNDKYNADSQDATFNVVKKDVIVTVDDIEDINGVSDVTITGKFTDINGVALINSNVDVIVNGVKNKVKTNKEGIFTFTATNVVIGENTITAGYAGNTKYNSYYTDSTFNVYKSDVTITVDEISDVAYNDNVTVTGVFTTADGQIIANENIKVSINGKENIVETDANGVYSVEANVKTIGVNTVTVSYDGNDKYNAYSTESTFNVVKKDTKVTMDSISVVDGKITITGTFTDVNNVKLIRSNIVLYINGVHYTVKTDDNGIYTFSRKVPENVEIIVVYGGNEHYNSFSTTPLTLTVL